MSLSQSSTTATEFRPAVVRAAADLGRLRDRIAAHHAGCASGTQTCALATDLFDAIVRDVWQASLADMPAADRDLLGRHAALVAHGGYGRREMEPFSDVDLMVLHDGEATGLVTAVAKRLLHDLFDAGLNVGHSVRSVSEALTLAAADATIFSSLLDVRPLGGRDELAARLAAGVWRHATRGRRRMTGLLAAARAEERAKFGDSVFLLEPNVKRSPGGLRDVQLARWLALVWWGDESWAEAASLDDVVHIGGLTRADADTLRDAGEFLLRLRCDLHLHAGKCADDLTRDEQVRIAAARGIEQREGMLGVERFMQEYFHHTRRVADVVEALLHVCRRPPRLRGWMSSLLGHRVDGRYRVGPQTIDILPGRRGEAAADVTSVLRLLELASVYDLPVEPRAWHAIRAAAPQLAADVDPAARGHFLALFDRPARLGESLRRLHEVGLLEAIIPPFAHARHLLQFNNYHKYTVDEHCIVAVEKAVALQADAGWIGDVWRQITRKRPVLLALLIHDLGKGFVEDHSEVGARIARDVARLFALPADEAEIVEFLVLKHLAMAHIAFRRDVGDDSLVVRFARDVGSPEVLRMLTVLTAADVSAVGPGTWTRWKADLLGDLFFRTLGYLDGESPSRRAAGTGRAIERLLSGRDADDPVVRLAGQLPQSYLRDTEPARIIEELGRLARLPVDGVFVATRWQSETATVAITVGTRESVAPGVFHRLTGGLSGQRLEILAADIHTLDDGLVIDHFVVHDPDFSGQPPAERLVEIADAVKTALMADQPPAFTRRWNPFAPQVPLAPSLPPRVLFDNESSSRSTILEVFADDSPGLLYSLARAIFDAGLSVKAAKIGTYLDQVVDAFHVTDAAGRKVTDPERLAAVRGALERAAGPVTAPLPTK
jgi:[protein-PII] uridylyltransferase